MPELPDHLARTLAEIRRAPSWRAPEPSPEVLERQRRERERRSLAAAKQRISGMVSTMAASGTSHAILAAVLAQEAERRLKLAERLEG